MAAKHTRGDKPETPTGKERMDRARREITANIGPRRVFGCADPLLARVVADPLRVQIIMTATTRELSAKGFAEEWDIPEYGAHYQMQFLRKREFIEIVDEVRRRGAMEIFYRATRRALIPDLDWAALNPKLKPGISNVIVEELFATVARAAEAETLDARDDSILWWQEVPLDEITFPKAMMMQRLLIEKLVELGAETAENQAEGRGGRSFPGVFALMGFEGAPEKQPYKRGPRKDDSTGRRKGRKRRS